MHPYVILTRFTRPGIENVAESPARTRTAVEHIDALGGNVREFFVLFGRYDGVLVADFPDDEAAAGAALALGRSGAVTTETMRGFDLASFERVVAGLDEAETR